MTFGARAQSVARALGVGELELLGIEITNPKLRAALELGGFTLTTMPVPEELGAGIFDAVSRIEQLKWSHEVFP